ncbi:MAG: creatininase family protein [candidate division Zixibacteria bacterium]|nr:creatininase family protein [candidate division Zixibacteria bacterium]
MSLYRLEELNSPQLSDLAAANAVVILPISPLEEHGPHLPLGTDAMHASHFSGLAAEVVASLEPDTPVIIAPLIPIGTHVYRFMGSIFIRQRVIRDMVIDYGESLSRAGFRRFLIVSAHGGPGHMVALDEAATILTRHHRIRTVNLTSTIIYRFLTGDFHSRIEAAAGRQFTAEEQSALSMDYHGGWWETAMMLWLRPDLVDQKYKELPDALVPRWRLRPRTPLRAPAGQGYLGAPARADREFAEASLVVLREEATRVIRMFLDGTGRMRQFRSPLYWVPILRTNFRMWVVLTIVALLVMVLMSL